MARCLSSVKTTALSGVMGPSLLSPGTPGMIRPRLLAPPNVTIHSRTSRSQWLLILFSRAKSCYIFRLNILPTKTRTSWGRVQETEYSHTNSCMESQLGVFWAIFQEKNCWKYCCEGLKWKGNGVCYGLNCVPSNFTC